MTGLSKMNQTLISTNSQLDYFSKELAQNPKAVKPQEIEKFTHQLEDAAKDLAKEIKDKKTHIFKADTLKSNLSMIGKLKKNDVLTNEFKSALSTYESQLKTLKTRAKRGEVSQNREVKMKPAIQRDKDVGKHLTVVNTKLKSLLTNKEKITAQHFKELTTILMKTNVALTKAVAFHNTLSNQYKPDYNSRVIQGILNGINNLGNQAQVLQTSNQAVIVNNFNMTVAEAKGLLEQVLDYLKESRGKRVSKVRNDRAKK